MTKGGTETYNGNGPQCPYCEHEHKDDDWDDRFADDQDCDEYKCKGCGELFRYTVYVERSFTGYAIHDEGEHEFKEGWNLRDGTTAWDCGCGETEYRPTPTPPTP